VQTGNPFLYQSLQIKPLHFIQKHLSPTFLCRIEFISKNCSSVIARHEVSWQSKKTKNNEIIQKLSEAYQ
jgi:hypothetical protein